MTPNSTDVAAERMSPVLRPLLIRAYLKKGKMHVGPGETQPTNHS